MTIDLDPWSSWDTVHFLSQIDLEDYDLDDFDPDLVLDNNLERSDSGYSFGLGLAS